MSEKCHTADEMEKAVEEAYKDGLAQNQAKLDRLQKACNEYINITRFEGAPKIRIHMKWCALAEALKDSTEGSTDSLKSNEKDV